MPKPRTEWAINPDRIVRDVVVIGGSAGSYSAITTILTGLPVDFPAIVGVVIHRGAQSRSDWSLSLGRNSMLDVREGKEGELLGSGHVYIAPNDRHMTFVAGRIKIDSGPPEHFTRPAVNPLFVSAALQFGPRVVGVVLSGCGSDGTSGLVAISHAKGLSLIQLPSEAEQPSMPTSAAVHDHVQASLHIDEIAGVLIALVHGSALSGPSPWASVEMN
jgi:two-component system, chemotaxis family, protein-glutamate methylesterase/glutaminase